MKSEVYWIPGPWSGRLGIVPRPRGGDWLDGETQAWRQAGIHTVVSLLMPEEVDEFLLQDEGAHCREDGLDFLSFPILDRGVPSSRTAMLDLVVSLESLLRSGHDVVVHCRQGIGRSSLLASSLLAASGTEPQQAFHTIEEARGRPVPDTAAQREWVEELASDFYVARHQG